VHGTVISSEASVFETFQKEHGGQNLEEANFNSWHDIDKMQLWVWLAQLLRYMKKNSIFHTDLSKENILCMRSRADLPYQFKLIDFEMTVNAINGNDDEDELFRNLRNIAEEEHEWIPDSIMTQFLVVLGLNEKAFWYNEILNCY
jgi:hypothetical protein